MREEVVKVERVIILEMFYIYYRRIMEFVFYDNGDEKIILYKSVWF